MKSSSSGGSDSTLAGLSAIGHAELDEYAGALLEGKTGDPEDWLRARSEGDPPHARAVAALRAFDLLIRHRVELGLAPDSKRPDDTLPPGMPAPSTRGPTMSDPSSPWAMGPGGVPKDPGWFRAHQLELLGPLDVAQGGMGMVALAWHTGMKREVVLKLARERKYEDRFRREIEVHAKLGGHAHIAVTRTPLLYGDSSVLVVDYVAGPSLRRQVELNGPLPWPEASECIRQAAMGLGHAHAKGVIHRDVKPSNLIRSRRDGVVCVIDWGLALDLEALARREDGLTEIGQGLGTPAYRAPEQAIDATAVTATNDLYSLGCT